MAELVLGPMLRSVDGDTATVWVETDEPCTVAVTAGAAGGRAPTFTVACAHYALVVVSGLAPATTVPYEVSLDGEVRWPVPGDPLPASTIRTADPDRTVRVVFGSCRVAGPHGPPHDNQPEDDPPGRGVDALEILAWRFAAGDPGELADALVLIGDQIYADADDDGSTRCDLDDFRALYRQAWSSPGVRWLLSTVPSLMVFDDHDVVDDWNLSAAWLTDVASGTWDTHIEAALLTYWCYQHLGNLTATQLADDAVARQVLSAGDGADEVLRAQLDHWRLDRSPTTTTRWSATRDLVGASRVRIVNLDSRNGRRLIEGDRSLVGGNDLAWAEDAAAAGPDGAAAVDHLLIGTSVPWLLPHGVHNLERGTEAVAGGAWGPPGRRLAESARRRADLEHWPGFGRSFEDLSEMIHRLGEQPDGTAPSSVLVLSGDVHFSYIASAALGGTETRVAQLVSSPLRNGVPASMERMLKLASSRAGAVLSRLGRRVAGPDPVDLNWSVSDGPWFGNGVATLGFAGDRAWVRFQHARLDHRGEPDLITVHEQRLAGPPGTGWSAGPYLAPHPPTSSEGDAEAVTGAESSPWPPPPVTPRRGHRFGPQSPEP